MKQHGKRLLAVFLAVSLGIAAVGTVALASGETPDTSKLPMIDFDDMTFDPLPAVGTDVDGWVSPSFDPKDPKGMQVVPAVGLGHSNTNGLGFTVPSTDGVYNVYTNGSYFAFDNLTFKGMNYYEAWVDFSQVNVRKVSFTLRTGGLYGTSYETDTTDGVAGMQYLVQGADGNWEAKDFDDGTDHDGCIMNISGYKGLIRIPLSYFTTSGGKAIDPETMEINCFGLWISVADDESTNKLMVIDDISLVQVSQPQPPDESSASEDSSVQEGSSVQEESSSEPAPPRPASDQFIAWMDFESVVKDTNLTTQTPGILADEAAIDTLYKDGYGSLQVKGGVGATDSAGFVLSGAIGDGTNAMWGAATLVDETNTDGSFKKGMTNFASMGKNGGTDLYFYLDTTGYVGYKPIKDAVDEDKILGYEETAQAEKFVLQLFVYDEGTAAGEELTAYAVKKDAIVYLETAEGWKELKAADMTMTFPKNQKGYVRIPRSAMYGIWGAEGDKIDDSGKQVAGDGLFNGPFGKLWLACSFGGPQFKDAKVVIDNIGFLGSNFDAAFSPVAIPSTTYPVIDESSSEASVSENATSQPTSVDDSSSASVEASSEVPAVSAQPAPSQESSSVQTPNVDTGSAGVGGMVSALSIAALAISAAVVCKKKK